MTEVTPLDPAVPSGGADSAFPTLTPAQIARVAAHGRLRPVEPGGR